MGFLSNYNKGNLTSIKRIIEVKKGTGVTQMDLQKVIAKLKELRTNKDRRARYAQHIQRQEVRLGRIARLLRVPPDEAKELMELAVEYLSSEGILTKKAVKLSRKRIPSQQDNDVKRFLVQNGLCD